MSTMVIKRALLEQVLEALVWEAGSEPALYAAQTLQAITALRAALAQQKDPTDPGNDVDVLREHVRHLERQVRQLHAQQDEPQGCATEEDCTKQPWCRIRGECQRKQAEPVEATLGYARKIERLIAQRDDLLQALKKIRGFTVDGAVVYAAMVDINAVASRAIKAAEAKE